MCRRNALLLVLTVGTLSFRITLAQTSPGTFTPFNPDSALQIIVGQLTGTPLALQQAVESAMQNATSVRSAEASLFAAQGASRREAGAFDPEIFFAMTYADQETPTASFFAGAPTLSTKQTTANGGLRMLLPIGTSVEASMGTVRLETNSAFAFLNPQYTASGSLSIRQPLLGGFHISARKHAERTDSELDAARARYEQETLAVRTEVEQLYWDLYAAERDYAVQRLTRERAEAFLRETELRARTGLIGPNQVANARTFLAEQEILLLDREEQLDRVSDQLASLIAMRPPEGSPRFLAVDNPPAQFPEEDIETVVKNAVERNLSLRAARADVEARRASARAGFWEALPRMDLVGTIGGNGLTGAPRDVIFGSDTLRTTRMGSLSDALRQAWRRKFPTWSVGIELTVPIGLRSGLGEQERLEAEVALAEQRVVQLKRLLEEQVRSSYRDVINNARRLTAARDGVQAAQEQVRIGLIEFQNGRTTAFELVRLGADFAAAQQRYSQALVRSAKAAARLRQLTSGAYPASSSNER